MNQIECSGLYKAFGETKAVNGVDLVVESGTICALLGPSGCGKTTTLRLIGGFERPDAGTVTICGKTVAAVRQFVPPEKRSIGMVFQDYALFPHYDVAGNVAYALGRENAARVHEVLELVRLTDVASRYPHELSGGQQQRVALARALAPKPGVILLDEPFSNLDAALRAEVRREIREILAEAGVTSVFVTHDQDEALSMADTVAVMREGQIEQHGTPEEVYDRPATRWVAEFVGETDVIPGIAHGEWVECELARIPVATDFTGPVEVVVRPESVAVSSSVAPGAYESHEAVVVSREFYGHDQLLYVELKSGRKLRCRRFGFPAWHPGDRVRLWIEGPVWVLPAVA